MPRTTRKEFDELRIEITEYKERIYIVQRRKNETDLELSALFKTLRKLEIKYDKCLELL